MKFEQFYKKLFTEGFSHAVDSAIIAIWGPKPYNIDMQNALLHNLDFKFKDDEGKEHDGGHISITGHESSSPLTYQQEKTRQIRETVLSIKIPEGAKDAVMASIKKILRPFNLNAEYLPQWRKPQTRK